MGYKWNSYRRVYTKCPYYKRENRQVIYCSGIRENSLIHIAFGDAAECKKYKDDICKYHHQDCHIYKMLEGVFNEDEQV